MATLPVEEEVLTGIDALSDFSSKLVGMAGAACDIFNTLADLLGDALKSILAAAEAAIAAIAGVLAAIIKAAKDFIDSILDVLNGVLAEIFAAMSLLMDDLKKLLGEIVLSVSASACGVVASLSIGVPAGIVGSFDAVNNVLSGNPIAPLIDGVNNFASKTLNMATSITDAALENVNSLRSVAGSLGINV